jgi:hypothetical protein
VARLLSGRHGWRPSHIVSFRNSAARCGKETGLHAVDWMRVLTIALLGTLAWLGMWRLTEIVRRVLVRGEADRDSEKRARALRWDSSS